MSYAVVILGGTGFVGSAVIRELLNADNNDAVLSIARHSTGITDPRLIEIICPLEQLSDHKAQLSAKVLILVLGANLQQGADYRQVDCEFGLTAATLARRNGVEHCIALSAALASRWSPLRYLRIKARFEDELRHLGFKHLTILRPGPLTGRAQRRWQEALLLPVLQLLAWVSGGAQSPICPISGFKVASCIARLSTRQDRVAQRLSSAAITDFLKNKQG